MIRHSDPKIPRFSGKLELLARQVVEGFITGLHKSPFHGFSVEFAEHRIYNPGESTRHIDWKLYGRTEKLFVKRFEEETNLRCQLILDNSSSMYFPHQDRTQASKIAFSVECAAAISYLLKKQRDAVGLSLISDHTELHTPARSSSVHHQMIMNHLEKLYTHGSHPLNKPTDTASLMHYLADNLHKRSLVVIFSDMLEEDRALKDVFSALQHMKHNKHEVILFHVYERSKELEFDFDKRPTRFVDMETGQELRLNPRDIREAYIRKTNERFHEIRLRCLQNRIDFVPAEINQGYEKVLLSFLIKRAKLY